MPKGNTRKQYIFTTILSLFLLIIFIKSCNENLSNEFFWSPSLLSHQVIDTSPEFELLWVKSNTFTLADDKEPFLAIVDNQIVLVGSLDETKGPSLISLDLTTGNLEWEKSGAYSSGFANDENSIYIGLSSSRLRALSIETGAIIWDTNLYGARNFSYLIPDDTSLHVLSSTDNYYNVDKESGELLNSVNRTTRVFVQDGFVFNRSIGSASMTVEDTDGNRIWQIPLNDPFAMKLVFTEEFILVRTLQGAGPYGQLYVLDRKTGAILWKTERGSILSNAAVSNDIVYYLSVDAQLIAADVRTGQSLGTIDFTPDIVIPTGQYRHHSVAADKGHVVVYLGDSQQLFAFNFLP